MPEPACNNLYAVISDLVSYQDVIPAFEWQIKNAAGGDFLILEAANYSDEYQVILHDRWCFKFIYHISTRTIYTTWLFASAPRYTPSEQEISSTAMHLSRPPCWTSSENQKQFSSV